MDKSDVRCTMIGSDGMPLDTAPHPRLCGTFPRVLGHRCRDVGLFSLEEAVHKMTGLTAGDFRLPGRGVLREGAFADITVFDADRATWDAPTLRAEGIDAVVVNGRLAWQGGRSLGARSGRVVRLSDTALSR